MLWAEIKVDFRSEDHSMGVDRSVGELGGLSFDGFCDGVIGHVYLPDAASHPHVRVLWEAGGHV